MDGGIASQVSLGLGDPFWRFSQSGEVALGALGADVRREIVFGLACSTISFSAAEHS